MFCHNCRHELPKGAKFCPKCGTEILIKQETKRKNASTLSFIIKKNRKNTQKKEQTGLGQVPLFRQITNMKQNAKRILVIAGAALVLLVMFSNSGSTDSGGNSGGSSSFFSNRTEKPGILDCLTCDGDGDCNTCGGYGRENFYAGAGDYVDAVCSTCHGSGNCRTCGGSGKR